MYVNESGTGLYYGIKSNVFNSIDTTSSLQAHNGGK